MFCPLLPWLPLTTPPATATPRPQPTPRLPTRSPPTTRPLSTPSTTPSTTTTVSRSTPASSATATPPPAPTPSFCPTAASRLSTTRWLTPTAAMWLMWCTPVKRPIPPTASLPTPLLHTSLPLSTRLKLFLFYLFIYGIKH